MNAMNQMNVIGIKLNSGEELIARRVETLDAAHLTVEKPMVLAMAQDPNTGAARLALFNWLMSPSGDRFDIPAANLTCEPWAVDAGVEREYLSRTSGIALV